ncbi:MAG: hypothetical protein Q8Q50_05685 [Methylobacter sp.]|nr:hypothetical protein [Methylobacter sp.]
MKEFFTEVSEKIRVTASDLADKATTTAKEAGTTFTKGVETTGNMITDASSVLATDARSLFDAGERQSKQVGLAIDYAANVAGNAISETAHFASQSLSTIAVAALDQNGDGELNQEDLKIATEKCVDLVKAASKEIASSSLVKETAAAAAIGAAIAIPAPLIGPMAGAFVGASLGAYKHFTKK